MGVANDDTTFQVSVSDADQIKDMHEFSEDYRVTHFKYCTNLDQ